MEQKETPNSPMNGGQGVEVSKTLFYLRNPRLAKEFAGEIFVLKLKALAVSAHINILSHRAVKSLNVVEQPVYNIFLDLCNKFFGRSL